MSTEKEQLETLTEIRSLMERSSRFISLSGLSGVFSGIFALAGAAAAYYHLQDAFSTRSNPQAEYYDLFWLSDDTLNVDLLMFFFYDAALVLLASLAGGIFLTVRNSRKHGNNIWDSTSKRLLINLLIPLTTGGIFCLILLYHGLIALVAPATLVFYGLALVNASKYTLDDIRYLGICEIALGLAASVYIGYGLFFWAIGFGVLHIIYGTVMYFKYERK